MFSQLVKLGCVGAIAFLVTGSLPARAESCRPLSVLGAPGTSVKKTVSPLGTLVTNDNWNTDFAVPGGVAFSRFVASVTPENDANYDVKLNLKYSNNTADKLYDKSGIPVKVGVPLQISGEARSNVDPYQVNVFVGGLSAIGNTYTVSVVGCN